MRENKNAAPMNQIGSGEDGQLSLGEVRLPDHDSIMPRPGVQAVSISSLLMSGEENAVPLHDLAGLTGLDARKVRRLIQRERLAGIPILANCRSGYFLPADAAEKERCARSMLARAAEIKRTAEAIAAGGSGRCLT